MMNGYREAERLRLGLSAPPPMLIACRAPLVAAPYFRVPHSLYIRMVFGIQFFNPGNGVGLSNKNSRSPF